MLLPIPRPLDRLPFSLTGLTYGLALSRLLYEIDPLRFGLLGGLIPALIAGLALAGLGYAVAARLERSGPWMAFPALLPWPYILTSPEEVDPLRGGLLIGGSLALLLMLACNDRLPDEIRRKPWDALLVALPPLLAYLLTLQRTVGRADTFEFQVTAPVLGVAHPTGYPSYILLGKLFTLLPIGSVAARVNLTSAVMAALAASLLYLTLSRPLGLPRIIAALGAWTFAFSATLWSQAVIAEVYAFHNAFVALILLLSISLLCDTADHDARSPFPEPHPRPLPASGEGSQGDGRTRHLHGERGSARNTVLLLFLALGLSLSNHLTTVILIPGAALALYFRWPRLSWKVWLAGVGLFLLGLSIYLYIPLRWPALHEGALMPLGDFIGWITGSRFSGALLLQAWLRDPARWAIMGRLILDQFGAAGVLLGLIGIVTLARTSWRALAVTGISFGGTLFYGLNYLVPDIAVFVIPLHLIHALWMAVGVDGLVRLVNDRLPSRLPPLNPAAWRGAGVGALAATLFALIPLRLVWTLGPGFDWRAEAALEDWGRSVLSLPLDEGSAILADSEKIAPLEYLHRIEGLRPDMAMVVLGSEEDYRADLFRRVEAGQTVYLARLLPGLEGAFHLRSVGPLVEVGTAPLLESPAGMIPLEPPAVWGDQAALIGYAWSAGAVRPGEPPDLTLYWASLDEGPLNPQVRVRLVDPGGAVLWENQPAYPVADRYPMPAWKPGEIIPDSYRITLPLTVEAGATRTQIALAPPFSAELIPDSKGLGWLDLPGDLTLTPGAALPPVSASRRAIWTPGGAVLSAAAQEASRSGTAPPVTITSLDQGGGLQRVWTEAGEQGPFTVRLERETLSDGSVRYRWLISAAGGVRCGWLSPVTSSCVAAEGVQGASPLDPAALANFSDRIALNQIAFPAGEIAPGAVVEVALEWQSLGPISVDYTLSVQLIGPDGLLYGQVDGWPVQGTYPTSSWGRGEIVAERVSVPLRPDAPPGRYTMQVVLYDLSTNTRLLILDQGGNPLGDAARFDGLYVP